MSEEITAFRFDELLDSFRHSSSDATVRSISLELWGSYDDLKDHKVVASKEAWDYFNRILLLLSSDSEIEEVRNGVRWHVSQILPAVCFFIVVFLSFKIGWNQHLLEVFVLFGFVSMAITWFKRKRSVVDEMYPFPSFRALSTARRNAHGFSKQPWPKALAHRRIRHPLINALLWIPIVVFWLILSPVALFIQSLPDRRSETRLRLADPDQV